MAGTNFLPEPTAVRFDADVMWVSLADGRTIGAPLAFFPRLTNASDTDLADVFLSPSGLHWDTLDEDISIATLLAPHLESIPPAKAA